MATWLVAVPAVVRSPRHHPWTLPPSGWPSEYCQQRSSCTSRSGTHILASFQGSLPRTTQSLKHLKSKSAFHAMGSKVTYNKTIGSGSGPGDEATHVPCSGKFSQPKIYDFVFQWLFL